MRLFAALVGALMKSCSLKHGESSKAVRMSYSWCIVLSVEAEWKDTCLVRLGGFCARRSGHEVSFSDSKHSNCLLGLFCVLVCDAVTAGYACFAMIVFGNVKHHVVGRRPEVYGLSVGGKPGGYFWIEVREFGVRLDGVGPVLFTW